MLKQVQHDTEKFGMTLIEAMNYKLTIGWLYPELMSTYGDRGNIICLQKRCEWRNIQVDVIRLDLGFKIDDLKKCDLLFMGGAQDKQQKIVASDFSKEKVKALKEMVENGTPGLYVCGAYQFLGKYYKEADGEVINGLGILDLYTENPGTNYKRLIGDIAVKCQWSNVNGQMSTLVGFENHGGRTYLEKDVSPLAKVLNGFGNNGEDKTEGARYKNSFCSYFHGPILPKNPYFADLIIKLALKKKYKKNILLMDLDDTLELQARNFIFKKLHI